MVSVNGVGGREQDPSWSLLNDVLRERSAEFRAQVYELVTRYKWDVNDPNFLILMATGQMEVLLEQFPDQFEAVFVELLGRLQQQGGELKSWLAREQGDLRELIRAVEMLQAQETAAIQTQVQQLQETIAETRQWTQEQSKELLRFAEAEQKRVEKVLLEEMKGAQKEFLTVTQKHASLLAGRMFDMWTLKMRSESFTWGVICGGTFFMFGLILGVVLHMKFINDFTDMNWSSRLWGWNQERYLKCRKAERKTCEFNIVKPGE